MAVILQENLISCYFGSCTFIDDICNSVKPNKCIFNLEIIVFFYSAYSMIDRLEKVFIIQRGITFLLYFICIVKFDIFEWSIIINLPNHHRWPKNRIYSRQNEMEVIYLF